MNTAFDVKSTRLDALSIQLQTYDITAIQTALEARLARFGDLRNMPFTLDAHLLDNPALLDLGRLIALFARYNLHIIALRHSNEQWSGLAKQHRVAFSILPQERADSVVKRVVAGMTDAVPNTPPPAPAIQAVPAPAAAPAPATNSANVLPTMIIDRPIRTGQQVYAENADLIVLGLVSEGAEIIADGNIHIYGPLRGRALAGASGNKQARIFAQFMQAELVSVAGIYRVFDQALPAHLNNRAVQIYLQEDRLVISAIQAA